MIKTNNFNPTTDPRLLCTCGHKECDRKIAVFGATPTMQGRITIDGVSRDIIRIKQVPAAGNPIAWVIFVKG